MENFYDFTLKDLEKYLQEKISTIKKYHSSELFKWVYEKGVTDFNLMTNISKAMREELKKHIFFEELEIVKIAIDKDDGTRKLLIELIDSNLIEAVIIPAEDRLTLCVSSQVGCAMACKFCLTSQMGFVRNLRPSEIVGQLRLALNIASKNKLSSKDDQHIISNIVFMGMGEPLNNLENVAKAISIFEEQRAFGYSKRRITVSTCGVADKILELPLCGDPNVAISLNSATDIQRESLMPVNRRWPLVELFSVLKKYPLDKGRRITFEYILFKDLNDSVAHASALVKLLKTVPSKVNLICFNEYKDAPYKTTEKQQVIKFQQVLMDASIQTNIRESRGKNILAACGQLATDSGKFKS